MRHFYYADVKKSKQERNEEDALALSQLRRECGLRLVGYVFGICNHVYAIDRALRHPELVVLELAEMSRPAIQLIISTEEL